MFADRIADMNKPNRGTDPVFAATEIPVRHDRFFTLAVPVEGAGGWPVR